MIPVPSFYVFDVVLEKMLDARFLKLKFVFDNTKINDLAVNRSVISDDISAGGQVWRFNCHPRRQRARP